MTNTQPSQPPPLPALPPPDSKSLFAHFLGCFKKYAVFKGRARRREYWGFFLFLFLMGAAAFPFVFVLSLIVTECVWDGTAYSESLNERVLELVFDILWWIVSLPFVLPLLAVTSRRLHDTGRSINWVLYGLILAVVLLLVALMFLVPAGVIVWAVLTFILALGVFVYMMIGFVHLIQNGDRGSNAYGSDPKVP